MESKGKVIAILPKKDGISKNGNQWATQQFVIETQEQYTKKQCFEVFGVDLTIKLFSRTNSPIVVGNEVVVSFDIESREYTRENGTTMWITSARAWKVELAGWQPAQQAQPMQSAQPAIEPMPEHKADDGDGLPF